MKTSTTDRALLVKTIEDITRKQTERYGEAVMYARLYGYLLAHTDTATLESVLKLVIRLAVSDSEDE